MVLNFRYKVDKMSFGLFENNSMERKLSQNASSGNRSDAANATFPTFNTVALGFHGGVLNYMDLCDNTTILTSHQLM